MNWSLVLRSISFGVGTVLCASSYGQVFKVNVPHYWKKISIDENNFIYENTRTTRHERVILQSFGRMDGQGEFEDVSTEKRAEITEARAKFMKLLGLGNFNILEMEMKFLPRSKFKKMQIIHSQFRGLGGTQMQSLERQYVNSHRMFIVTYLVEAPALNNRHSAQTALDYFEPIYAMRSREPASAYREVRDGASHFQGIGYRSGNRLDDPFRRSFLGRSRNAGKRL